MRAAGLVVGAHARDADARRVAPGVTTGELDALAEDVHPRARRHPVVPGYQRLPGAICASVNDEVVHGIPRRDRVLRDGDLISIDCGAIVDGWHGDAAITVPVGEVRPGAARAVAGHRGSRCGRGLAAAAAGGRLDRHRRSGGGGRSQAGTATASSRATAGTASAPRCTWTPHVPNYGRGPAAGPARAGHRAGDRADGHARRAAT